MFSMTNNMRGRSSTRMELDEEVLLEEEGDLVEMDKKKKEEEEERITNSISISPHGLLPCPLCRADISLRAGTLAKVYRHMEDAHGIFHNIDSILTMILLEPYEKQVIMEKVMPRLKKVLEKAKGKMGQSSELEKRLLEEKDESPAKKLKIETRETETKKMEIISEGKVKKAQNVQEKLAEIKSAYNENTKDDIDDHCGADKVRKVDEELDVAIEKTEKEKEGKDDDEDEAEREEKQNASDSYCQICKLNLRAGALPLHMEFAHKQKKQVECEVCQMVLAKSSLRRHMRVKHPDEEKPPGENSVEEHKKDDLEVVAAQKTTLEENVSGNVAEVLHEEKGTKEDKQKQKEDEQDEGGHGETLPESQDFECVECDKKVPKRKRVRHQWMHEQINERKRASGGNDKSEEEEAVGEISNDSNATSSKIGPKMFECPHCLKILQKANKNRHMRRCQKANIENEIIEEEKGLEEEKGFEKEEEESLEEDDEIEKEGVVDESESNKMKDLRNGTSRKYEPWQCQGCKKSMQRQNSYRHLRNCEISRGLEDGSSKVEDISHSEEQSEKIQVDDSFLEEHDDENGESSENQAEMDRVEDESDPNAKWDKRKWECGGCKKIMQKNNKNRHIRRCELAKEENKEEEERIEEQQQQEQVNIDVESKSGKEEVEEKRKWEKMEWECRGCKKTMQRGNKGRHLRRCDLAREEDHSSSTNHRGAEHSSASKDKLYGDAAEISDEREEDKWSKEIKQLEIELNEESAKNEAFPPSIGEVETIEEEEEKELELEDEDTDVEEDAEEEDMEDEDVEVEEGLKDEDADIEELPTDDDLELEED